MTSDATIVCPHCRKEIRLTESLAAPLIEATRQKYEQQLLKKDSEMAAREAVVRQKELSVKNAEIAIEEQVQAKLSAERVKLSAEQAVKAREEVAAEIAQRIKDVADLQSLLKQRDEKLAVAQNAQADLIRKQRELDDAKREMELTIETRVQDSLTTVRNQARLEAETALTLQVKEKETTIAAMQKQIEDLRRRAEQGSQQLQGEAQELHLEAMLLAKFPKDTISPVPKGEYGGDVVQQVHGAGGEPCGTILWESKRTKNWSDGWLSKLRDDQRAAKAELAVLATNALPKEVETFDFIDGIWVAHFRYAIPVAVALRQSLIELSGARVAAVGQQTKTELIYHYLTGPRFRHRVEAIVEKFTDMQDDLEKERRLMTRQWAKREEQIRAVVEATAGMYGDLQGIAGKSFQEISGLDNLLIEDGEESVDVTEAPK